MEKELKSRDSKFKEYFKRFLLIIITLALIETVCFFMIKIFFPDYATYKGKRVASGYTLYYNTPGFNYSKSIIKNKLSEKDLAIDSNGFAYSGRICITKPSNTIRIFLMGGSALFGLGQAKPYDKIKAYPDGVYSYESSIAGCLKRKLDSLYHNKNFEVINAGCSGFTTKQSMMLYLDKVCHFSPDFIIEMDGFNDLGNITFGSDKENNTSKFKSFAYLISMNKNLSRINTLKLIQLIQNKMNVRKSENKSAEIAGQKLNYNSLIYTEGQYLKIKKQLNINSEDYLRTLNRYSSILKADSVKFIFMLQPLLNRQKVNKQLSKIEQLFVEKIDPVSPAVDEVNSMYSGNAFGTNITPYDIAHLMLLYYFDDGFSDSLKKTIEDNGYVYIDANKEMQNLGKDFEFFVDYCHMTIKANEFVARMMANEIIKQIPIENNK